MTDKVLIDDFFQQVEEKLIGLLSERENLLKEREHLIRDHQRLNQENTALKAETHKLEMERDSHTQKLEGIISLLDSISLLEQTSAAVAGVKLDLVQG
jgi:regulator of replication initiation timing